MDYNNEHDHGHANDPYHWRLRDYVAVAALLTALSIVFVLIVKVLPE